MALEPTYCRGAQGDIVIALQHALQAQLVPREQGGLLEPALKVADGKYGIAMQRAVQRVQRANGMLMTGVVDVATWKFLMHALPWPSTFERMLSVVAGFEGHFYGKATGDRKDDRVGMTWGLIGFTLVQPDGTGFRDGPLRSLLADLYQQQGALLDAAFGASDAARLEEALKLEPGPLRQFAINNMSSGDGNTLREPWSSGFAKLGESEPVRQLQRDLARSMYYKKAEALAGDFGTAYSMACERTLLYFLDLAINNGNLEPDEKAASTFAIERLIAASPHASVAEKLQCITDVLAASRPRYARIIRERKGTLAYGYGYVNGLFYRLDGWAINVAEPAAPAEEPCRLAVLGLGLLNAEQLALARQAHNLLVEREAAVDSLAEGRFPQPTGYALLGSGGTRTVSMRGLATEGAGIINANSSDQYQAAQMLFRGHTGMLVISGQITQPLSGDFGDHYVLQRAQRTYAGLALRANDQLMLVRQRKAGMTVAESVVDITDLRSNLGGCALIMLYSGYGVPMRALPGSGPRWREWVGQTGAKPLVLGWFGNVGLPQDIQKRTLADEFFGRVALLGPGKGLLEICSEHGAEVIEQWGIACHTVFAASRQKYLWLDEPIPTVLLTASGAAAIDGGGQAWRANPGYPDSGQAAMIRG